MGEIILKARRPALKCRGAKPTRFHLCPNLGLSDAGSLVEIVSLRTSSPPSCGGPVTNSRFVGVLTGAIDADPTVVVRRRPSRPAALDPPRPPGAGTKMILRVSRRVLSLLALRHAGARRVSHVDD
jgi:hypothetical protein